MTDNGALGVEFVTATVDAIIKRGVLLGRKRVQPYHHPNAANTLAVRMLMCRQRDIEQSYHLEHCRCQRRGVASSRYTIPPRP